MDAAALLLLAGVGVGFGWQPMPDGTPRSEYIVQIEPEMLESLAAGQSVPIVSEVSPGVAPIGRVRVVVGRSKLPQHTIETRHKPVEGANGDAGIVLTQYTVPPAPRYATPPAAAATPPAAAGRYGDAAAAFDPYTQAPPAQGAIPAGTWNSGSSAPATAGDDTQVAPIRRLGDGLQNAAAPIQQGFDRVGQKMRDAADRLGDRTGQLLDELGRPLRDSGLAPSGSASAAGTPPASDATLPQAWNGGEAADPASSAGGANATAAPGGDTAWNGADTGVTASGTAGNPPRYTPNAPGAGTAVDRDPWDNAADPQFRTGGASPNGGLVHWPGDNPQVPDLPPLPANGSPGRGIGPGGSRLAGNPSASDRDVGPTPSSASPAISADMLALPGDRALDGFGTLAVATTATSGNPNIFAPATAGPPAVGTAATAAFPGWGQDAAARQTSPAPNPPTAATPSDARSKAAVILAWVLLFASFAGNMYLFWSYLDVRTKYRALVRKTARAVGSRFSAV